MDLGIEGLIDASEIGAGGAGRVYRAYEPDLERYVAVKMLQASYDPDQQREFQRERRLMASISAHPGIAPIYQSGTTERGENYFVMPFYAHGSLEHRIRTSGPLPWREAANTALQIAAAVNHAHSAGVLHCDLKPDNIMIDDRGQAVVVDFGIAQLLEGTVGLSQGIKMTPGYAAPEAFEGRRQDERSDVYSLGATLFALMAGSPPFSGEGGLLAVGARVLGDPVPNLRDRAPDAICRSIEKAMAKSPDHRHPDTASFIAELTVAMDGEATVLARPTTTPDPAAAPETMAAAAPPPVTGTHEPSGATRRMALIGIAASKP